MERFKAQGTQSATETCNDNYTKPNTELFDAYLPEYDSTYLDEPANQNYNLIEALKRIHIITYLRSILEQLYSQAKKIALEKARQKYIGACLTISFSQKISLLVITIAISFCHFILGHQKFITCFILILNFLYLITIVYKSILFFIGNKISKNSKTKEPLSKNNKKIDAILPIYTILLPLYKEKSIVSKLLQNIQNINYPKNKLQVLLILEEKDLQTIQAINKINIPEYFKKVIVPFSFPQTKAKACNHAMKFVIGKYLVIYDAEDKPDPEQLLKAIELFNSSPSDVVCAQAKLHYHTYKKNYYSEMSAIEYTIWFDYFLPGLHKAGSFIPLGGTSNHFKTEALRKLNAWDPYNVTEDADLGLRIAINGYKTEMMDSYTYEAPPTKFFEWLKQRSRWIKVYMQTYLVHSRQGKIKNLKPLHFFIFQLFFFVSPLTHIISPLIFIVMVYETFCQRSFISPFNNIIWAISLTSFFFGICLLLYTSYTSAKLFKKIFENEHITNECTKKTNAFIKHQNHNAVRWWLYPIYFIPHSLAAVIALFELCTRPHYWYKTPHLSNDDYHNRNSNQ